MASPTAVPGADGRVASTHSDPPPYELDFEIPCRTPDGGWAAVDPRKVSDDARNDLSRVHGEGVVVVESLLQPVGRPVVAL